MNKFRIWLADLVTGGDYSYQKEGWRRCSVYLDDEKQRSQHYKSLWKEAAEKLQRIAAQEKPTSNSTVKRICRIARGEE